MHFLNLGVERLSFQLLSVTGLFDEELGSGCLFFLLVTPQN